MSCKFKIQNSKCKIEIQNLKFWILICNFAFCILLFTLTGFADDKIPSGELITKAWDAHGRKDTEATSKYTQQCIDLYGAEADKEQALLKELPKGKEEIEKVVSLNDVATAYFIRAESCMRQDKLEEAKKLFQFIIARYPYAQAWDMRGWYWSLKTASEQSIKKLETVSIEIEQEKKVSQLPTKIVLYDAGKEISLTIKNMGNLKISALKIINISSGIKKA